MSEEVVYLSSLLANQATVEIDATKWNEKSLISLAQSAKNGKGKLILRNCTAILVKSRSIFSSISIAAGNHVHFDFSN
jgi:hypothetical protein